MELVMRDYGRPRVRSGWFVHRYICVYVCVYVCVCARMCAHVDVGLWGCIDVSRLCARGDLM